MHLGTLKSFKYLGLQKWYHEPWIFLAHSDVTLHDALAFWPMNSQNVPTSAQRFLLSRLLQHGLCRWWWYHGIDDEHTHWGKVFRKSLDVPSQRGVGRPADMVFWVTLIAMRLLPDRANDIHAHLDNISTPLRILLLLLDLPHDILQLADDQTSPEEEQLWANKLTIGHVLNRCYRREILREPETNDYTQVYRHALELGDALALLSIWAPQRNRLGRLGAVTVEDIRNMRVSEFWQKQTYPHELLKDSGQLKSSVASFNTHEMSVQVLRKVGKIKIIWTEYLDEHMTFDSYDLTLKVFWFGFDILANPIFQ